MSLPYHIDYLPLGGGGLVREIQTVTSGGQTYATAISDGTMAVRFYPGDTRWTEINNTQTEPNYGGRGFWSCQPAPSDPTVIYAVKRGQLIKSTNSGGLFAPTNFPQMGNSVYDSTGLGQINDVNGFSKYQRGTLAVDPVNSNVVYTYIGDAVSSSGPTLATALVYRSLDGGATVTAIGDTSGSKAITTSLTGNLIGAGICFDPSSGTTGGKTNRIIIPTHNSGVWESTDAGSTFTNIAGNGTTTGPVGNVPVACMTPDGIYFCYDTVTPGVSGQSTGKLWKLSGPGGTWSEVKDGASSITFCWWITANQLTAGTLVIAVSGGFFKISIDYGAHWTVNNAHTLSGDVANIVQTGVSTLNNLTFDATTNGKVWLSTGTGIWYVTSLSSSISNSIVCFTAGQEELVSQCGCMPPGGTIYLHGVQDRAIYRVFDPTDYLKGLGTTTFYNGDPNIDHCTDLNYSSADHSFIVANCDFQGLAPASSTDHGATWTNIPDFTPWYSIDFQGLHFNQGMSSGQTISGIVTITAPSQAALDVPFGPVSFNTSMSQTLIDIGNACVAADSRLSFSSFNGTNVEFQADAGPTSGAAGSIRPLIYVHGCTFTGGGATPVVSPAEHMNAGNFCAANSTNWMAMGGAQNLPFYTKDGGSTWKIVPGLPSCIYFNGTFLSGQAFSGKINGTSFGPVSFNISHAQTLADIRTAILAASPTCGLISPTQAIQDMTSSNSIVFWEPTFKPVISNMSVTGSGTQPVPYFRFAGTYNNASFLVRHILVADRIDIGTFYLPVHPLGLMKSTDGGDNWTIAKSGNPFDLGGSFWACRLRAHPSRAGELLWTTIFSDGVFRSTDHGSTWTHVANTTAATDVDWGRATIVGNPEAVWLAGTYNGTVGVHRSLDDCATFTTIVTDPQSRNYSLSGAAHISGDLNDHNRYYMGLNNGAVVGYVNNKWRLTASA